MAAASNIKAAELTEPEPVCAKQTCRSVTQECLFYRPLRGLRKMKSNGALLSQRSRQVCHLQAHWCPALEAVPMALTMVAAQGVQPADLLQHGCMCCVDLMQEAV